MRGEQRWTPGSPGKLLGGGPHRLSRRPGSALERRGTEGLPLFSHTGPPAKALQVGPSHTTCAAQWEGSRGARLGGGLQHQAADNNSKCTAADVYRELSQVSGPLLSLYIKALF